jgi:hypothetical protein
MAQGAKEMSEAMTPVADLLDEVPEDIVLGVQGNEPVFKSYHNIPIGRLAKEAAAEIRRLLTLAHEQHTEIYGLRLKVMNLEHNIEVLTNAVWKACGDDEQVVNDTIESQGTLR